MKKILKFWFPAILWMGVIFIFSSIPNLKTDFKDDFILRKIAHAIEFAILALLLYRALFVQNGSSRKAIIYALIVAVFYACSDEFHQLFIVGRHGSIKDVGIDSIGILLVGLIWYIKKRNPAPRRVQGGGR